MPTFAGRPFPTFVAVVATAVLCAPLSCTTTSPASGDAGDSALQDAAGPSDARTDPPKDGGPLPDAASSDAKSEAAVDPCPIGGPADGGARASFESELTDGVWLFGEGTKSTWVRFNYTGGLQGSADYLPASDPGYFPCKGGIGLSTADASTGSAILQLPADCLNASHIFEFLCVAPGSGTGPHAKATLQATIRDLPPGVVPAPKLIKGYRYPKSQCAADMSSCSAP